MFPTVEQLENAMMGLPAPERARLAERLIASLDEDSEVERAWAAEIRRRVEEHGNGTAATTPASEVFDRVRSRIR
ncbi:MAG: addiction module protein [Actinomycetota bacterium]|nr:addiction module protein [Rubrobacter sp.]MDQ3507562.1 addiction module protein [Actinomycetota bacterium]